MSVIWKETGISQSFIEELRNYCTNYTCIEKVILFGSRARGDFRKTSDIDIAIFTSNASHSQENIIEDTIKNFSTPLKIDVLFKNRITKEKLISNILRDGVIIFEQGTAQRKA